MWVELERFYDEFTPQQNFITLAFTLFIIRCFPQYIADLPTYMACIILYTHNICFIIRSVIVLKALGWPVSHTKQMALYVVKLKRQHSGMAT